jgi:hypothetical protein
MTEPELIEMALRTVAADLEKMLYDRPGITAQLHEQGNPGEATRFVHSWIRNAVEDLQDRLTTYADDRGIEIEVKA